LFCEKGWILRIISLAKSIETGQSGNVDIKSNQVLLKDLDRRLWALLLAQKKRK
jgi:hypothetical protein